MAPFWFKNATFTFFFLDIQENLVSSQEAAKEISVKLLQKSNSCISIDHLIPEIGITKINLLNGNTPIERKFFQW